MTLTTADVVVIGCGGFGSSALYHLAKRGVQGVGIDQFRPPHDRGSSHGETRVIRKAYFEHPDYVPLLRRAYTLWDELQESTGTTLFQRSGLLLAGAPDGEVISGTRAAQQQHDLDISELTRGDAAARFPQFVLPDDCRVLFESDAGFLWCERCVETHLQAATASGAACLFGERVQRLDCRPEGVTVQTDHRTVSARVAVVTAGAWTGELLPDYAVRIRIRRKTLFWLPCTSSRWTDPACPIHLFDLPQGQFYGCPSVDGRTVKVAEHTGGAFFSRPDELQRNIAADEAARVEAYVAQHLNGVEPHHCASGICMYSMSPDGHFLLDHFRDRSLIVAAGFSGHGFKFTSVLGEAVADLVQTGTTSHSIGFLSVRRLADVE